MVNSFISHTSRESPHRGLLSILRKTLAWPMLSMSFATSRSSSGVVSLLITACAAMTRVCKHLKQSAGVLYPVTKQKLITTMGTDGDVRSFLFL